MVRNYENICCQDLLSYSFTHGTCDIVEDGYRVAFATSPEGTLWHLVCQEWGRHEQVKSFKMIVYDDYSLLEIERLIRQFDPRWRRSGSHLETVTSSSLSEFIRRHLCSLLFSRASGTPRPVSSFYNIVQAINALSTEPVPRNGKMVKPRTFVQYLSFVIVNCTRCIAIMNFATTAIRFREVFSMTCQTR